jgi:hypothetical protein
MDVAATISVPCAATARAAAAIVSVMETVVFGLMILMRMATSFGQLFSKSVP